jgi:hypothetical protein
MIYDDYANVHSTWEFKVLKDKEKFSATDLEEIEKGISLWAIDNLISPYRLLKTDKSFEITIGTFCHAGSDGMAQDLFLFLSRNVFRKLNKSISYCKKS